MSKQDYNVCVYLFDIFCPVVVLTMDDVSFFRRYFKFFVNFAPEKG